MKFTLSTDTSCDVFRSELRENCIAYVPLTYSVNGTTFNDDFSSDIEYERFYATLNQGMLPTTSQINAFLHEEYFDSLLAACDHDIIHLSLSSGLSGTYTSACIGAKNSMDKFRGRTIHVIDTLSATQGHRYLLDEAQLLRDQGATAQEAAAHLNNVKHHIQHWLLADDLLHLRRGGRVNVLAAYLGTVLNIKPIIAVDDLGKLSLIHKAKGHKQCLRYFLQMMETHGDQIDGSRVYIANGNSPQLAQELKTLIQEQFNAQIKIGWIGPIIGAHTGGGTLGLVFKSKTRITHK